MVYGVGILGFICGFIIGQYWLYKMLKYRSNEDLLHDRKLRWTYGILNWIVAGIGAYSFVFFYNLYFG